MKKLIHILAILALALVSAPLHAEPTVVIHAKLFEITRTKLFTFTDFEELSKKDLNALSKEKKGIDVMNIPALKTPSGKTAEYSATRTFAHKESVQGESKTETGIFLFIRPTVADGRFQYSIDYHCTTFVGFTFDASRAPIFDVRKVPAISGECDAGKEVVLDLGRSMDVQTMEEPGNPPVDQIIYRQTIAVISFELEKQK